MAQLLRVHSFLVSADGFGSGEGQSLEKPFGHANPADLGAWAFAEHEKWRWYAAFAIGALLWKEDVALAVALLGLIAYFAWRSYALSTDVPAAPAAESAITPAKAIKAGATPAAPADGAVVITASETAWVKIYDADKKSLFESEMKAGESYTVPADANNPMILTGRPQALSVTVGGKAVATLGEPDRTISDVGVTAAALLARKPVKTTGTDVVNTDNSTR